MSFFDSLFSNRKPKTIQDPVFGELTFENGLWSGFGEFALSGMQLEYFIEAGESGPTPEQHAFYHAFSAKYSALIPAFCDLIRPFYREKATKLDNFNEECVLVALIVPDQSESPLIWDITFASVTFTHHFFTVVMEGWTPVEVKLED